MRYYYADGKVIPLEWFENDALGYPDPRKKMTAQGRAAYDEANAKMLAELEQLKVRPRPQG